MTDVDLFNIIGTPAISFLPNDSRELVRLMATFGAVKDNKVSNDGIDKLVPGPGSSFERGAGLNSPRSEGLGSNGGAPNESKMTNKNLASSGLTGQFRVEQ